MLESECLEIESATSNKAVNQKPQHIVKLSQTTTIYREQSISGCGLERHESFGKELTFFSICPQKGSEPQQRIEFCSL